MKIRIIITSLVLLFTMISRNCYSQDLIILNTGDEIQSIVKEVGINIIKYKKFENQQGPVYTIEKSKVFMIKYQNGSKDVFTEQSNKNPIPKTDSIIVSSSPKASVPKAPEYLTYKLGVKKNKVKLTNAEVRSIYANCPEALNLFNGGVGLHGVASTLTWLEIGMMFLTGYAQNNLDLIPGATKQSVTKRGLSIIGGMMVVGISCNIGGHQKKKKSVVAYNEVIKKTFEDIK
ncbi:MAG: hypothetical protein HOD63_04635 [Bacteroidetes bacterium]|jgi:hypothetical protein|nr:hypothetical protein [Bacteroidota bacterium]MBT5530627.1 hypothetical protein [Cytophagia bacterium]MBT3421837.1 hypothetical protein [Bacteroidota bacterium]MBT3800932.1 hypothetical protein [Bacteroidota bacterium]MBT3933295.1 hypothetical protein [Bacteroidota bacterium]